MSSLLTTPPATDPALLLRYRDRQYAAELMAAALLHLDLFSWLEARGGAFTEDIAGHFQLADRPLDVLLTLCRAAGTMQTDVVTGHHSLTPTGREHLVSSSPWFLGPYYEPVKNTPVTLSFLEVLRSGKPRSWQAQSAGTDWHESMKDPEFARSFTALMNCRGLAFGQTLATALAPMLEGRTHLLDVGGGSGIYSSTLAAAHPELTAVVLEQPPVDAITRSEIARHGLEQRIRVLTGDMFLDPWPSAGIVLLSNLLHDWDVPEVRVLLKKSWEALAPGGLLVIHEAFISDDKTGPLAVAEYSALLMNITQGKCYSAAEYAAILGEIGFAAGPFTPTIADRGFMTAVKS